MKNRTLPILSDHDAGLAETVAVLRRRELHGRRRALRGLAAAAILAAAPLREALAACAVIPSETEGPYPGDGTNGPNVLTQSGIVRSDIRASFGASGSSVAAGTLLTVTLTLVNTNADCAPLEGYAVYLWHCDRSGGYSLYSSGVTGQNYLRGVQVSDAAGRVTFATIFPGAYSGRWPHAHFEIFSSLSAAVSGANAVRTSQLALPDEACRAVYAQTTLYPGSLSNHNQTPLSRDGIFANDNAALQMAATSGSVAAGYAASLQVGIAAPASAPDIDQQGLTGMWYEAASSGQGLALEVFPDLRGAGRGHLQGGWFTYDVAPAGGLEKQRWYTFAGDVLAGSSAATVPLYANTGGNFDAGPATPGQAIGSVRISFSSCVAGQFAYTLNDGRSGTIPITRLTPSVACSATTTRPTNADFALGGNWYDPSTSGQGFIIEVNPVAPVVFFTWYTYAASGQSSGAAGQRWFTGQGPFTPGSRSTQVTLYETTGGTFDTDTPATQSSIAVGTATLTFDSCTGARVAYAFTAGAMAGRSRTIQLSRLAGAPAGCSI